MTWEESLQYIRSFLTFVKYNESSFEEAEKTKTAIIKMAMAMKKQNATKPIYLAKETWMDNGVKMEIEIIPCCPTCGWDGLKSRHWTFHHCDKCGQKIDGSNEDG